MDSFPFPPCDFCKCAETACADHFKPGTKVQWPELVGVKGKQAVEVIKKENPLVTPWIVAKDEIIIPDVCCNRVLLVVDSHSRDPESPVIVLPQVG